MQYESLVYGCIIDNNGGEVARVANNRAAMLSLPCAEEWSFLFQEMFSTPEISHSSINSIVHFGASYRGIEYEWQNWISQFERLLQKMYWVSAKVHLDTVISGTHIFTWDTESDYHSPGCNDMRVQCEWSKESAI